MATKIAVGIFGAGALAWTSVALLWLLGRPLALPLPLHLAGAACAVMASVILAVSRSGLIPRARTRPGEESLAAHLATRAVVFLGLTTTMIAMGVSSEARRRPTPRSDPLIPHGPDMAALAGGIALGAVIAMVVLILLIKALDRLRDRLNRA